MGGRKQCPSKLWGNGTGEGVWQGPREHLWVMVAIELMKMHTSLLDSQLTLCPPRFQNRQFDSGEITVWNSPDGQGDQGGFVLFLNVPFEIFECYLSV